MADTVSDDTPRPRANGHQIGQDLSLLSVDELEDRAALLRAEIARLDEARQAKIASKRAADRFFRSDP